jgi:hypothetical protein
MHSTIFLNASLGLARLFVITVSEMDLIQSIIVGSFLNTNHCTVGLVREPKAKHARMSVPSGYSGRFGICDVNCEKNGILNFT